MDLKQLEYFRHVAELGSFTNAAAFLSVGQPTLSRQIADLEMEIGQELFDRNGRGVVLTQAGCQLLEHTRGILMQVGRARQELEDQRNFTWTTRSLGLRMTAGHLIEPQGAGSRVTLSFELSGFMAPAVSWFYGGMIERYVTTESQGLKKRSESGTLSA